MKPAISDANSDGTTTRRDFIVLLAGFTGATLSNAGAEQPKRPTIGFLSAASEASWASLVAAFRLGLGETGFVVDQNVTIEFRWAEGRYEQLRPFAEDLVRRKVDVLVATGGIPPIAAAIAATKTIPIVFTSGADPVERGFVASLSRPGGNATGVTMFTGDLVTKRLELVGEFVASGGLVGLLVNPTNPNMDRLLKLAEAAAPSLALNTTVVTARDRNELGTAFAKLAERRAVGLVVVADPLFESHRIELVALAKHYAIPTIYAWREDALAGGLMSYGASITEMYREAGLYAGKILKGARPEDMPVQRPSKLEMVINLKAATALGLKVPAALLTRADEIIE